MRSVERLPTTNKNCNYVSTIGNLAATVTLGPAAFLGVGVGVADAEPVITAPGTNQGHVGPAVTELARPGQPHYIDVATPGRVPVVDPGFLDSVQVTADAYADTALQSGSHAADGYSSSAISLHKVNAENAEVAYQLENVVYYGDSCMPDTGILVASAEARMLTGQTCPQPSLNPYQHETYVYDREDSMARFHMPVSLIDLANMLAAHEERHTFNSDPSEYTVSRYEKNGDTYIRLDHYDSALKDWAEAHGLTITNEMELIIQGGLHPDARSPLPPGDAPQGAPIVYQASAELPLPLAEEPRQAAPTTAEAWQQEVPKYVAPEVVVPVQQLVAAVAPFINALPPPPVLPPPPFALPQFPPPPQLPW